jgi:hypothetical protein
MIMPSDNGQTFTLTATNTGTTAATGTATIKDDGTGDVYSGTSGTPTANVPAESLNDDRPLAVNDVTVNEGSPYAVFTVTGATGQYVKLALAEGTAKVDADGTPLTDGTEDYGPALEYYNGTSWVPYTANSFVQIPAGGTTLLVRTAIINDIPSDNGQTFTLTATNTGTTAATGTATIKDDGTGDIYSGTSGTPTANVPAESLNDDRPLAVNDVTVNEGSPYAVFTVTGATGQYVKLALAEGTAKVDADGTPLTDGTEDYGPALEYFNGTNWVPYTANSFVQIPAGGTTLLVRTAIINDIPSDNGQTFTLTATNTGTTAATGTATIKDDGTGDIYSGTSGTPTANVPAESLNDDRSLTVNDVTVNEGSPYMVFTVSGISNQAIHSLALANSTSGLIADDSGVDYGALTGTGLEYWDITSGVWVPYVTGSVNLDSTGTLLVRTPIVNDTTNDNGETFKLVVTSMSQVAVTGTGTILDNGSGTIFVADDPNTAINEAAPTSINNVLTPPTVPEQTAAVVTPTVSAPLPDDDRPLTVNDVTVNEGSPYAVFTVTGATGQYVKLALGATNTGTDATLTGSAADIGQTLQYFNGTGWVTYTSGSFVQIPTDGNATPGQAANLLVRVAVINDVLWDGGETFTLTATNTGTLSDVGTGTILDNGTGDIFSGNSGVPDANVPAASLNNDQPVVSITATDPAAVDDKYSVLKGGTVTLTPLSLDSHPDGVNLGIVSINGVILTPGTAQVIQVTEGTVNVSAAGEITFTPNASFTGTVTIPYVISDGQGGTATANEIITVKDNIPYVRNIGQPPFIAKPFEHPPLKMGYYEFNTVVLDFNGVYGGINQFSLPHGETTLRRGALQHSNHTPYIEFDRVGDELQNAQRTINTNAILSPPSNEMLPNSALPPDEQLDSGDTEISIPPPSALVGSKGDQKFTAFTKNGKPLPDWVKFNRVNGNFEIFSSDEAMEPVEIQVIGTDANGNLAETKPNNKPPVKLVPKTAFVGKESLTSQIKSALTFGKG